MGKSIKYFTLERSERDVLCSLVGVLCGSLGDKEDIEELSDVIEILSKKDIEQLDLLFDCLDDEETYKKITRNTIKDDIPLLTKIIKFMDDNDLIGENWDLWDVYEKLTDQQDL